MKIMKSSNLSALISVLAIVLIAIAGYAAYHHGGDTDSDVFRTVYPNTAGTKLDSCTTCHSGGTQGKNTYGSCQWCHDKTNYGKNSPPDFYNTLNPYGKAYLAAGRDAAALTAIEAADSDSDGYANKVEIAALRYPGDTNDDPAKVAAPSKVYTRDQLEAMPQHTQFLLMNVTKSSTGDSYAQYSGVTVEELLKQSGMLNSATGIIASSPDGFSCTHPLASSATPAPNSTYFVNGPYPKGTYHYSAEADMKVNKKYGWCDYSATSCAGRSDGDTISDDLRLLLGIRREGAYLTTGVLDASNRLNGDGPFRVIPPQVVPGPPDQSSTAPAQNPTIPPTDWVWPYVSTNDHNAGAATRSTTIIKVNPLPTGTTDIDLLEAGWPYIDSNKLVVYGAINPLDNIKEKLVSLLATVNSIPQTTFTVPSGKQGLQQKIKTVQKIVSVGNYGEAYQKLQDDVMGKMNGCSKSTSPDKSDWLRDCDSQSKLYWSVHEITVLLKILA